MGLLGEGRPKGNILKLCLIKADIIMEEISQIQFLPNNNISVIVKVRHLKSDLLKSVYKVRVEKRFYFCDPGEAVQRGAESN